MIRVGINGFGRIGRCALRQIRKMNDVEVVLINDLSDPLTLAYLYKYDSVHRTSSEKVSYEDEYIVIDNDRIRVTCESDASKIPWGELGVQVVLECTGVYTTYDKAKAHILAGARKVIISAPSKDDTKTIVYGVNQNILDREDEVISSSSCTTNALAPILNVLNENFDVVSGFMTTVHAMTNDQETLDITHKKGIESRRGRAASLNIVPTSTGAASGIGRVIPELDGKFDGVSLRVPVGDGSIVELTTLIKNKVSVSDVNNSIKKSQSDTLKIVNAPIVSSDIIGCTEGAVVDSLLTKVINMEDGSLVKVSIWYDNEWGYTAQMLRVMKYWMNLE